MKAQNSVSARPRHCGNPVLQSEMEERANLVFSFFEALGLTQAWYFQSHRVGLETATNTVTSATNISSLATKNSGLVAMMATTFLCVYDQ